MPFNQWNLALRLALQGLSHRDIQKTALEATETVEWHYTPTTLEAVEQLKNEGYRVFSGRTSGKKYSFARIFFPDSGKTGGTFLAHEVSGVAPEVVSACDGFIEIPQFGMKHSLNISVAAGIVLWELAGKKGLRSVIPATDRVR